MYTACATASGKSFVCAHDTAYGIAYVFGFPQERMAGKPKDTRSDANEEHTHPLTCTVYDHKSLHHGPIKIKRFWIRCRIRVYGIMHYLFLLSRFLLYPYLYKMELWFNTHTKKHYYRESCGKVY